jgi:hypothetical protein
MAANGNPYGGIAISGGSWPAYNISDSQGVIIGNNTTVSYVNYTICAFWNIVVAVQNSSGLSMTSSASSSTPKASPTNSHAQMGFPEISRVMAITALLALLSCIL